MSDCNKMGARFAVQCFHAIKPSAIAQSETQQWVVRNCCTVHVCQQTQGRGGLSGEQTNR